MFGPFKNFFGLDTVKLRLNVLEVYPREVTTINGEVELRSSSAQVVTAIDIRLLEVYTRGRGDDKRIDEYELGRWTHETRVAVGSAAPTSIFFAMPFEFVKSNMDEMGDKNFLLRGIAGLAKSFKGVHSDYYLVAEATVENGKLKPFVKNKIQFQ